MAITGRPARAMAAAASCLTHRGSPPTTASRPRTTCAARPSPRAFPASSTPRAAVGENPPHLGPPALVEVEPSRQDGGANQLLEGGGALAEAGGGLPPDLWR